MNIFVLATITAINLVMVITVVLSPLTLAWLSLTVASLIAITQGIVVYLVCKNHKRYRNMVGF
jgi:hypothetical protein